MVPDRDHLADIFREKIHQKGQRCALIKFGADALNRAARAGGISLHMRKTEVPMDPQLAEDLYNLDHCIECGCCVAACGTFRMRPDFVGAVAINKIARFRLDPRDDRNDADFYEVMGDDSGVFGCMSLLGCDDFCPKQLPLRTQIAFIRRKMAEQGIKNYDKVLPTPKKLIPIKSI